MVTKKYLEKQFPSTAIKLNYAEGEQNGPPMILLHGLGGRWVNWESVIDQFADTWHVHAIDLRGHGDSGWVPDKYAFIDYQCEVIEFIQEVIKQPVYVVGHSLGGITAAELCARKPELVIAAALEDPPLYISEWFDESTFAPIFQAVLDIRKQNLDERGTAVELRKIDPESSDEAIFSRAQAVNRADPGVWDAAISGQIHEKWNPDEVLQAIKTPILLMQANPDKGGALRDVEASRADELLENGRYIKWDDVGHGMHNEKPKEFVTLLNAFFGQILRKRQSPL